MLSKQQFKEMQKREAEKHMYLSLKKRKPTEDEYVN